MLRWLRRAGSGFGLSVCGARIDERRKPMRRNTTRPDKESPEWTVAEIRAAKPFLKALPRETSLALERHRGPQKAPTKELISLRMDRDLVAAYRATGPGWQTRVNEVLRAHTVTSGFRAARRRSG